MGTGPQYNLFPAHEVNSGRSALSASPTATSEGSWPRAVEIQALNAKALHACHGCCEAWGYIKELLLLC